MRQVISTVLAASLLFGFASECRAEGAQQLNATQALRQGTQLLVDLSGDGTESVKWTGAGQVEITDPTGTSLVTLDSGDFFAATQGGGAYGVLVTSNQRVGESWDLSVLSANASGVEEEQVGRVHSYDWKFNAGGFSSERATSSSFYALVPGGSVDSDAVVELKLEGLAGYIFNLNANATGVDGNQAGRSVPQYGNTVTPEFPIYLSPPAKAKFGRVQPEVSGFNFAGGVGMDVNGDPMTPCNQIVPGQSQGRFFFSTSTNGTYHIECDLDSDGRFDGGQSDLLLVGATKEGTNVVSWDGDHNQLLVPEGQYDCQVSVNVGEFHYVGQDIETSFPGMRIFEVLADGTRSGLIMRWNDSSVQASAQSMPNGVLGAETSGELGVYSGVYQIEAVPNENARSWGAFNSGGKGNQAFLDTYIVMASAESATIALEAVGGSADRDNDGLSDFEESCSVGSNPDKSDTDGDGVLDGAQYSTASSGLQGGLESNSRMGAALARRAIQHSRLTPSAAFALRTSTPLSALTPPAIDGLIAVDATPQDLTALTNAIDVYAVDYLSEDGVGRATVLLLETESELYEHNKAACSRAGGSSLLDISLWPTDGKFSSIGPVVSAAYRDSASEQRDQTLSFKLYEQPDGSLRVYSRWLTDNYPRVASGQRVVNAQLWSSRGTLARQLLGAMLKKVNSGVGLSLRAPAPLVADEDFDNSRELTAERAMAPQKLPSLPSAFITRGTALGSRIALRSRILSTSEDYRLRFTFLEEDGSSQRVEEMAMPGSSLWSGQFAPFLDATIEVLEGGEAIDRVWLSDGSWAPFDDGMWGGGTIVHDFSVTQCVSKAVPEAVAGVEALYLAGCARSNAMVDDYAGVARHLASPLDLAQWSSVAFYATSDQGYEVCLEDTESWQRHCVAVPASPQGVWRSVDLSDLESEVGSPGERLSTANIVTFASPASGANQIEIAGLTFLKSPWKDTTVQVSDTREDSSFWGCSVASASKTRSPIPWSAALLLGAVALRRRRRR